MTDLPPADSPKQIYDAVYRELQAARADNDRLRAALHEIASHNDVACMIAHRALKEPTP